MTVFERNIAALRQRQPELAERVSTCAVGPALEVRSSVQGPPTLAVSLPGKALLLLHSARDPIKEAQRLAAKYESAATENAVILGLGLGYHVLEYLKREHHRDFTLVIEPSLERFRCCLEHTDFSGHIGPHNLFFAVGLTPYDVFNRLKGEECSIVRNGLKAFKHPPSMALDPAYYNEILQRLRDIVLYATVNNNSRDKSWRHFVANMARNAATAMNLPGVKELFGAFDGVPAIIVSAGPSLGKNVRDLAHAKGRAVIIAVDTALRVLLHHGVRPDVVVSTDFSANNKCYFDDLDTSTLRLVADAEVYPPILHEFKGRCFFAEITNKAASQWFARALGTRGGLEKGLSVAHTAFLLAIEMGCRPIALVGQDLAYTGDVSHAKGAAMARIESHGPGRRNIIPVPDIFGRPVNSHASMVIFLRHFEELIHSRADRLPDGCIDATEGGARIGGTRLMSLKDFIVRTCTAPVDVDGVLDAAASKVSETDPEHAVAEVDTMRRELRSLARDAASCQKTLKQILDEIGRRPRDPARLRRLQMKYAGAAASLESHKEALALLAEALTRAMTVMRDRRLSNPSLVGELDEQGQINAVKQFMTIMDDIIEAAQFWLRLLHEVKADVVEQGATVAS